MTKAEKTEVAAADAVTPTIDLTDYSQPDANGHRWRSEKAGEQTRVYLVTKDGRGLNLLAETETKGKNALLKYLEGGN